MMSPLVLHPALRKLGRACIALARGQREQQATAPEQASIPPTDNPPEVLPAPRADTTDQETRDA
ncbi:MAG: hypothetical protein ACRDSL_06855 [Pseudonocardiaceae bacterium]